MFNTLLTISACGVLMYLFFDSFFKLIRFVKYNLYFVPYYFCCCLVAAFVWPAFLMSPKNVMHAKYSANILKHITKLYDLKFELRNGEILSEDRGAVVVSNHQSSFDVLGMFNIWSVADKLTAIAKKEIFYVWPFGLAAWLAGVVFIDRRNPKSAYDTLKVTSDLMVNDQIKIWMFPEGTRNKDSTKMLPFKKGAFSMAVHAQVPIIPVVFSPYYFINVDKYIFNKGRVIMHCLEPVPTKGLSKENIPELMSKIRSQMEDVYRELWKEVLSELPEDYPNLAKYLNHSK